VLGCGCRPRIPFAYGVESAVESMFYVGPPVVTLFRSGEPAVDVVAAAVRAAWSGRIQELVGGVPVGITSPLGALCLLFVGAEIRLSLGFYAFVALGRAVPVTAIRHSRRPRRTFPAVFVGRFLEQHSERRHTATSVAVLHAGA